MKQSDEQRRANEVDRYIAPGGTAVWDLRLPQLIQAADDSGKQERANISCYRLSRSEADLV